MAIINGIEYNTPTTGYSNVYDPFKTTNPNIPGLGQPYYDPFVIPGAGPQELVDPATLGDAVAEVPVCPEGYIYDEEFKVCAPIEEVLKSGGGINPARFPVVKGTLTLPDGRTIRYDSASELEQAEKIRSTIEQGGINPETGDSNISAGPNVLSRGDKGIFGFGSDYTKEFQENFDANAAHADNNPWSDNRYTNLRTRF